MEQLYTDRVLNYNIGLIEKLYLVSYPQLMILQRPLCSLYDERNSNFYDEFYLKIKKICSSVFNMYSYDKIQELLNEIFINIDVLKSHNIDFNDIHTGNIMRNKDGKLKFIDVNLGTKTYILKDNKYTDIKKIY